ncbi:MAG: signal peptidase I [Verrucomicrobiae bacterium]|nr:signal peptidase I [Verrucomicrobiae bacterium]
MNARPGHPRVPSTSRPLRRWILAGCAAIALLLTAQTRFGCVLVVGDSMLPSLRNGDLLLVRKHAYQDHAPSRGDVVVARFRRELVIKRIVGLPGEQIEVAHGTVCVNGTALPEPWPVLHGPLDVLPGHLAANRYAILGDNRSGSEFILFYAVMPPERLAGQAILALRWRWSEWNVWNPRRTDS